MGLTQETRTLTEYAYRFKIKIYAFLKKFIGFFVGHIRLLTIINLTVITLGRSKT